MESNAKPFFIAGGTVPPYSPSYVERQADIDLVAAMRAGEFCYVLDSRQKGKSSLIARSVVKLRDHGIRCATADLQSIGINVTIEQWYFGLLEAIGQDLDLEDELYDGWRRRSELAPVRRFFSTVEQIVADWITDARIAIFIDEIDITRRLPFETDEFFTGIRELANRRSTQPILERLNFCLVGTASPSQLIQDVRITPFNIGRRIDLTDFTLTEMAGFGVALGSQAIVERVFYWTHGHPFLTQNLAEAIQERSIRDPHEVDRLVRETIASRSGRQSNSNLADTARRILEATPAGFGSR